VTRPARGALGIVLGVLAAFACAAASGFRATPYDNFVLLADAFRHGRVWIDWPGPYIDALPYHGRYYVIEAPLPALLLLPAVMLRGTLASQSLLSAILGGVAVWATWEIGERLRVVVLARTAICGLLFFGTDLFWAATFGDVWFIAHVASVAFTMLALLELAGARRGWLVALFAACAVESRFALVLALPVYGAMLALGIGDAPSAEPRAGRLRRLATFGAMLVPFVAFYLWYDVARWGSLDDIGYTAWFHQDSAGSPFGSPFALRYLGYELQSFFVQGAGLQPTFPYVVPTLSGLALEYTSPALVLAFFARGARSFVAALWVATLLTATPDFIYYVNGYAQFGMRHALDFEPYLAVLALLATRRAYGPAVTALWGLLLAYSMAVGGWSVWYWRAILRH